MQSWQFSLTPFHNQSRGACWSLNFLQKAAQLAHLVLPLGLVRVAAGVEQRPEQVVAVLEALTALVLVWSWSMLL